MEMFDRVVRTNAFLGMLRVRDIDLLLMLRSSELRNLLETSAAPLLWDDSLATRQHCAMLFLRDLTTGAL